jgi:hypothetical protein
VIRTRTSRTVAETSVRRVQRVWGYGAATVVVHVSPAAGSWSNGRALSRATSVESAAVPWIVWAEATAMREERARSPPSARAQTDSSTMATTDSISVKPRRGARRRVWLIEGGSSPGPRWSW